MSPLAILLLVVGGLLVTVAAVWCAHRALRNQEREEQRREALARALQRQRELEALERTRMHNAMARQAGVPEFPRKSEQ